jgi:hypothetical protein
MIKKLKGLILQWFLLGSKITLRLEIKPNGIYSHGWFINNTLLVETFEKSPRHIKNWVEEAIIGSCIDYIYSINHIVF